MDVGGAAVNRVGDDRPYELDDRRILGGLAQLDDRRVVGLLLDLLHGRVEAAEAAEKCVHVPFGRDRTADVVAGHHRQVVDGEHVCGVGGGDEHDVCRR